MILGIGFFPLVIMCIALGVLTVNLERGRERASDNRKCELEEKHGPPWIDPSRR